MPMGERGLSMSAVRYKATEAVAVVVVVVVVVVIVGVVVVVGRRVRRHGCPPRVESSPNTMRMREVVVVVIV